MKKLSILFAILIMGLEAIGCATYKVQVNGYTDPNVGGLITLGSSFFVIENREARNPLLEMEIKRKIDRLLEQGGFQIVSFEKAEYYLLFTYGIGPIQNVTVIMPDYYPYSWWWGPIWYSFPGPFFPPPSSYSTYSETFYDCWLQINVVDGKYYRENKGKFRTLWVGEARSTLESSDLRTVVNYMLTATFEKFGKNTGKALIMEINSQDPRVKELEK